MKDRIKCLKDKFLTIVEEQLSGNLSKVNAEELGYVMDMAKDCSEIMRNCNEANYYWKITEAMESNSDSENNHYIEKYIPELQTNDYNSRMYFNEPTANLGHSHMSRKKYMDSRENGEEKSIRMKEIEEYMKDLTSDMVEMLENMDASEKTIVKQKLNQLAAKVI